MSRRSRTSTATAYWSAIPRITSARGAYPLKLNPALLSNNGPDVYENNGVSSTAIKTKQVYPLDSIYPAAVRKDFNQNAIGQCTRNGHVYCVSMVIDTGGVPIEDSEDHIGPSEKAQPLGGKVRAARAEGRELPADRGEIVEDPFTQECVSPTCCSFEAQDRPLASKRKVLRPVWIINRGAADQPDALAAPKLGNHDPPGKMLAKRSRTVGESWLAKQAKLLGGSQSGPAPEIGLQGVAIAVAESAFADHPVGDAPLPEVEESPWLPPERVLIEGAGGVHHHLLLQRQAIPAPLALLRTYW